MKTVWFILFVYAVTFAAPLALPGMKIDKILPFVVGACGILYQLLFNRGERFSSVGLGVSDVSSYLQVMGTVFAVMLLIGTAGIVSNKLYREMSGKLMFLKIVINVPLLAVLLTPIAVFTEELVFRGIIQRQLSQSMPPMASLFSASLVFGIWHIPFGRSFGLNTPELAMYVLGTALVGALAGIFYYHSGSLLVAGFLHGLWNAASYTVFGLGHDMPRILESRNDAFTHPEHGIIGVCVLICTVAALLFLKRV